MNTAYARQIERELQSGVGRTKRNAFPADSLTSVVLPQQRGPGWLSLGLGSLRQVQEITSRALACQWHKWHTERSASHSFPEFPVEPIFQDSI